MWAHVDLASRVAHVEALVSELGELMDRVRARLPS